MLWALAGSLFKSSPRLVTKPSFETLRSIILSWIVYIDIKMRQNGLLTVWLPFTFTALRGASDQYNININKVRNIQCNVFHIRHTQDYQTVPWFGISSHKPSFYIGQTEVIFLTFLQRCPLRFRLAESIYWYELFISAQSVCFQGLLREWDAFLCTCEGITAFGYYEIRLVHHEQDYGIVLYLSRSPTYCF